MKRWSGLVVILSLSMLTGCAVGVAQTEQPPLELLPEARPPIQLNAEAVDWFKALVNAYVLNCVALSTIRNEPVEQCVRGLR